MSHQKAKQEAQTRSRLFLKLATDMLFKSRPYQLIWIHQQIGAPRIHKYHKARAISSMRSILAFHSAPFRLSDVVAGGGRDLGQNTGCSLYCLMFDALPGLAGSS